jgi:tRNA A-37 threonylcarbamoyl transferase component Bud32
MHIQDDRGTKLSVACTDIAREIKGKRIIYRGRLNDDVVFIKLFIDPKSKMRHKEVELAGLTRLAKNNIPAPKIVSSGLTEHGDPVIVTQAIPDGVSLREVWDGQIKGQERQVLIERLLALIATHHHAGLQHGDPHLNNFFVAPDLIYTLDGTDIIEGDTPLDETASVQNLGLVLAQFQPDNDPRALSLLSEYCNVRDWTLSPEFEKQVRETILLKREWRKKKYLKKIYRECTQIVSLSTNSSFRLLERVFDNPDIRPFLELPDSYIDGRLSDESILKNGNTSTVIQLELGNDCYVFKRYNIKGPLHRLKLLFSRSRAERSWQNAHLLEFYGVPTAQPVAVRVNKAGPFRGRAWFVARYLSGQALSEFILDNQNNTEQLEDIADQVAKIIIDLEKQLIAHGDFKATNFQVSRNKVYLIDLDSMKQYRDSSSFKIPHQKDLDRFQRNWDTMPEIRTLFLRAINSQRDRSQTSAL